SLTSSALSAGSVDDLASEYRSWGWKADNAVLKSLESINTIDDLEAVSSAVRSIYLPWIEESALHLQNQWQANDKVFESKSYDDEECLLFIDGLRFDCAKRLIEILEKKNLAIEEVVRWSALPSLTGTGKYVVAPLNKKDFIKEDPEQYNFEPITNYEFKKRLSEADWSLVERNSPSPEKSSLESQKIWNEYGNIDHEGHDRGWKLVKHLDSMLKEIVDRIDELVSKGWKTIRIVTDHGWLLLPGGLPKAELASSLADNKWGRCASIKSGAEYQEKLYPWYWNPNQYFALAEGVSCYRKNQEYTHGGLSLQECLLLDIVVRVGKENESKGRVEITDVVWKGLRCKIAVDGSVVGLTIDIRTQAGNEESSVVMSRKPIKESGVGSVVVENEDLEGTDAIIVLIDEKGRLMAQLNTKIGIGSD
ncbi:MAG: BREX-1 system phosphatase PglZ type B, partial [Proteobacteria bacterium]|nr:BREX-1 system phosphatase PglZ type B [Pseudomonadota bacterium]